MRTFFSPALLLLSLANGSMAQDAAPVYQSSSSNNFRFRLDALFRQEWTQDIWVSDTERRDDDRRRGQLRPRIEFGGQTFLFGVGGDFNYSSDANVDPKPVVLRDNYNSRNARLDLAFAKIEPVRWLRIDGGRFEMPVALTEMIWDKDLRPQGAALTFQKKDDSGVARLGLTGLWARGSHVFDDPDVDMYVVSGQATVTGPSDSRLQFVASYVAFRNIQNMESMIRRQNRRIAGQFVNDYRVFDVIGRLSQGGNLPVQIVADICWNTAVSENRRGIWLAAALGSLKTSLLRAEYTFATVDKDATQGAYATDDFFWTTGWKGHRGEIATKVGDKTSLHLVGEIMRFKDSPDEDERLHWDKRYRLELRVKY
ncbi:MAG: putative porin [Vicinamibacteria bacterium]